MGCCLNEASFSPFSSTLTDFSKIRAALIFCFFLIKQKEKAFNVIANKFDGFLGGKCFLDQKK